MLTPIIPPDNLGRFGVADLDLAADYAWEYSLSGELLRNSAAARHARHDSFYINIR